MMLAIAPCFDEPTQYSFKWIEKLLSELGGEYTALFKDNATREKFEGEVEKHELVVFYGHGSREGLYAQGGLTYVIDKRNDHLLKGKMIYTMACSWASDGGIDAWKKGAKVVWGYTSEFGFTLTDEQLFEECANHGLLAKIKEGISWEEAISRAKKKFDEAIGRAKDGWSVIWLRHNRDALVCYTEKNPPRTSTCMFRRFLIRLLGAEKAWKVRFQKLISLMLTCVGYGVALHDFAHSIWELHGTIFSPEGGYVGFGMMAVGMVMAVWADVRSES
jgi:hypothetical protein